MGADQETVAAEKRKQQAAAEAEQRKRREEETKQRQTEIDAAAQKLHSERQKAAKKRHVLSLSGPHIGDFWGQIAGGICEVLMFIFDVIFS